MFQIFFKCTLQFLFNYLVTKYLGIPLGVNVHFLYIKCLNQNYTKMLPIPSWFLPLGSQIFNYYLLIYCFVFFAFLFLIKQPNLFLKLLYTFSIFQSITYFGIIFNPIYFYLLYFSTVNLYRYLSSSLTIIIVFCLYFCAVLLSIIFYCIACLSLP